MLQGAAGAQPLPQDEKAALYVSPKGSDERGTGRLDRPFATVARALAAARSGGPKRIFVRGGVYELAEPLVLGVADSGVRLEAWPGEAPVFSGGTKLSGVKQIAPGRWEVKTPFNFEQLYVNGQRRYRPRLPKKGYFRVAKDLPRTEGRNFERLAFSPGDLKDSWANLTDIDVLGFQVWTMARMKIKRVRQSQGIVEFTGQTIGSESFQAFSEGKRYLLENVKEALTEPGEWYLDRPTQTLTYLPLFDEKLTKTELVAPRLTELMRINGATGVLVEGITFSHTAWTCPPGGDSFWQAEVHQGAALTVAGGHDVIFENCTVRNVGAWAIAFEGGSKDCALKGCTLTDLGAGGVKIGERDLQTEEARVTERITVESCLIAHGGRVSPAGIGVWIGHSPYNKIVRNEITDFYYTAISPGWSWGYGESGAHHNEIAYNRIGKIGQGVLSDMGGIYTLGVAPGTTLHHNVISEIESDEYGGWGIYFDEGTTGVVAENNLVYTARSAPFHQHYGRDNIVRNNIFAFGREAQLMRTRAEAHKSFTLEKNIILWREGSLLGSNWSGEPGVNFSLSGNLYWKLGGGATLPPGDGSGLVADPKFTDAEKGDFRLRGGSPAERIGYAPWDYSQAGRPGRKPYAGETPRAYPPADVAPAPGPITEDFELYSPGQTPQGRRLSVSVSEGSSATVSVVSDRALSGRRSLKVSDAPGQAARYNPHLYWRPGLAEKALVGSFAIQLSAGAVFYHEWRDDAAPYRVGPSLRIENGQLLIGGKALMSVPNDTWLRLEIRCTLGTGLWNLVVRLPGRTPPRKFEKLACGSGKAFEKLTWWGFVSDADTETAFWLDDIALRGEK